MDKKNLERYRKLLTARRDRLLKAHDQNKDMRNEADGETNADMGDMAANAYTKEFLYSMSNTERETLLAVETALDRIKDKDFGACIECDEKVGKERLDAIPWACYCVNCQELDEAGRLRA